VLRYRLAVTLRRLGELAVERPLAVLRRRLDRAAQRTDELDYRLRERLRRRLLAYERRVSDTRAHLRAHDPRRRLAGQRARCLELAGALEPQMRLRLARLTGRLDSLQAQLGHLSPLRVLERGYALVQDDQGRLVRRAAQTAPGERLRVRLHEGRLGVEVRDLE
jgi:exodeoxyribonuclease VII large subunit